VPRPMHSGHIIYQWLPKNHGLHRVHHKHSESPDRTCECRQFLRNPTLSHADLTSLGPSFYSIYRGGWRTADHMPRAKDFSPTHLFYFLTRNARAMSLPSPRFFHATSMHNTSLFHSVFAGSRTLAFHPEPRKQAYVVFRGLCIIIYINVLACSNLLTEARRNK
jgi:hypothetical protein